VAVFGQPAGRGDLIGKPDARIEPRPPGTGAPAARPRRGGEEGPTTQPGSSESALGSRLRIGGEIAERWDVPVSVCFAETVNARGELTIEPGAASTAR
jgi:hypothetical protein